MYVGQKGILEMYEPGFPACKYGLAEHIGEQICVVCGKVFEAESEQE